MCNATHKFFASLLCALAFTACSETQTTWEFMPDMADQISVKAYEPDEHAPDGANVRTPPAGTIPRNFEPYPFGDDAEAAGAQLKNPLPRTAAILARGQKTYDTYCYPCHGKTGLGDGPVVPKFPQPPSLHSEKMHSWPDGRVFHLITRGGAFMPSYATQIPADERWAVVHYLRVLHAATHPSAADMQKALELTK